MIKNMTDITYALAGVVQAATLVNQVAVHNKADEVAYKALIQSIFLQDPKNTLSVYGDVGSLRQGLTELIKLLSAKAASIDRVIGRYVFSLLHLERKLAKSPQRLDEIGKRIQQIRQQSLYFTIDHPTIISNLAQVYLDNISTFSFRIQVIGNPTYISHQDNLDKIRALLLAGVRSAVLCQQLGGNRLQLFFARKKIVAIAREKLKNLDQSN